MAYQVLARKWRPRTFGEVVGQRHITRSLQNAICRNRLGHAYLLAGTRGIGKTSVARIFAKSLRCENPTESGDFCGQCPSCEDSLGETSFNICELDGASNNKVEDVRELIDGARVLPTSGRYKVYIIDEVHMLSTAAFNALLKTLESPPRHVVFILATTDADKLPDTVLSRCQRFDFKSATLEDIVALMKKIAKEEGIQYEREELVEMIARQGAGSMRDALSCLDRVLSYTEDRVVREDALVAALGLVRTGAVRSLVEDILAGRSGAVSKSLRVMLGENVAVDNIVLGILDCVYGMIDDQKACPDIPLPEIYWIYENLARDMEWARASSLPEKSLEVVLKKITLRRQLLVPGEKVEVEPVKEAVPEQNEEPSLKQTWQDFIAHLEKVSPVSASNLSQGNIVSPVSMEKGVLSAKLAFKHSGKVFYEHLSSKAVHQKIVNYLGDFFRVDPEQVKFELNFLERTEDSGFKSLADIERETKEKDHSLKEKNLRDDPIVQKASSLFKASVAKVQVFQE